MNPYAILEHICMSTTDAPFEAAMPVPASPAPAPPAPNSVIKVFQLVRVCIFVLILWVCVCVCVASTHTYTHASNRLNKIANDVRTSETVRRSTCLYFAVIRTS